MRWQSTLTMAMACGLAVEIARGGDVAPPEFEPIVVVATVKTVSAEPATNGKPPRVVLAVHQVLRGDARLHRLRGIWDPPFHGIDTSGREVELKAWELMPMNKPTIGQTFILSGRMVDTQDQFSFRIHGYGKIPFTPAALQSAKKRIDGSDAAIRAHKARAHEN